MKLQDGKIVRHITQIRKCSVDVQVTPESSAADLGLPQLPSNNTSNPEADSESDQSSSQPQPLRRSARIRHPPDRYRERVSFS